MKRLELDAWTQDPHILALASILQVPIVILDQMAPTDSVVVFTPENRSFIPVIRSWEREILPAFREGYRIAILH